MKMLDCSSSTVFALGSESVVTVKVSLLLLLTGRVEGRVVLLQWFSSDNTAPPSTPHLRMSDGKARAKQSRDTAAKDSML